MTFIMSTFIVIGTSSFLKNATIFMDYVLATYAVLPGLITLYITLYYIWKCERSLNVDKWREKYKNEIFNESIKRKQSDFTIVLTDDPSVTQNNNNNKNNKKKIRVNNVMFKIFRGW